jgi:hypothetical protein
MIEKIVITALIVLSIWYSMQEGEIFGFVTEWGEKHIPEKLQQPLFACNVCLSPWYGSVIYWGLGWLRPEWWSTDWVEWIVVVIGAMGVNAAINKLAPDK